MLFSVGGWCSEGVPGRNNIIIGAVPALCQNALMDVRQIVLEIRPHVILDRPEPQRLCEFKLWWVGGGQCGIGMASSRSTVVQHGSSTHPSRCRTVERLLMAVHAHTRAHKTEQGLVGGHQSCFRIRKR